MLSYKVRGFVFFTYRTAFYNRDSARNVGNSEGSTCARICLKGKVKCTLVQALRLCTGRTAHRGSRDIALPFHDHGTRRG